MENLTKIHEQFSKDLTALIDKFHKEQPCLYIENIEIINVTDSSLAQNLAAVRVKISVQPYVKFKGKLKQ